jgi:membrane protease YdiL (CAAX protease family)
MRIRLWNSAIYWLFMLAAVPVWVCLVTYFDAEPDFTWFYHNPGSFVLLAALLPVLEEIVFRGFIQEQLTRSIGSSRLGVLTYANILTSIIFSAMHFINHPPVWALLVFIPSLVFGYSKDRFDTLLAPILLHLVYNSGYYLIFGAG